VKRRWVRWAAPSAFVLVVAAVTLPLTVRTDPSPPDAQVWIATLGTIRSIRDHNEDVAAQFFDQETSYALGGWGGAVAAQSWASEAQFEIDVVDGVIPDRVRAVMYDPEAWAQTPAVEQRDPIAAFEAFASTARRAGYQVIITPHPNLVTSPDARCQPREDETVEDAFLRCGITGAAARVADVVEIQAQYLETDLDAYADLVDRAAGQARAANPDIVVIAGLSTRFAATPRTLVDAWTAVRGIVDGHYMGVPERIRPDVAAAFLQAIASG